MVVPRRTAVASSGRSEQCTSSACRDDDDDSHHDIQDYVTMLVQDWLRVSDFRLTLQSFVNECKQLGKGLPSPDKWYAMTQQLQFDQSSKPGPPCPASLLESVIRLTISERQREVQRHRQQQQQPQQQTVLVSKRLMQVKELKLLGRRGLSPTASAPALRAVSSALSAPFVNTGAGEKTPVGRLRPKSAAVCSSTPELIARSLLGDRDSSCPVNQAFEAPEAKVQTKARPISASGVLAPTQDSISNRRSSVESQGSQSTSPQQQQRHTSPSSPQRKSLKGDNATDAVGQQDRCASRASISGLPLIIEDKLAKQAAQMNDLDDDPDEEGALATLDSPALDLEDMSEERLVTHFASLDKSAIKKLRRVLAKSSACTQEFERSKRMIDKIQTKAKLRQARRVIAVEQTALLSNSMDILNKEPCSLCQHIFLKKNLVMRVSFKSIADLRRSWAAKNEQDERLQAQSAAHNASSGPETTCELDPVVGSDAVRHDESEVDRAQLAHLYDEAPICAFCSQLVLNCSSYRPSSAARKPKAADGKRHAVAQQKQKADAHARELTRCDPLDFDSYRLNSDDDGDDSDVEEVLEFDADGRPHVTKRRRQKTGRIPAQLGLVSKRLHYDQLRSRTLPSLNNKEWQVIS